MTSVMNIEVELTHEEHTALLLLLEHLLSAPALKHAPILNTLIKLGGAAVHAVEIENAELPEKTPMRSLVLIRKAHRYRVENPRLTGGVIVFRDHKLQGWVNELRNPEHWMPGCIAVDTDGRQWQATGGNDYDGATQWTPILSQSTTHKN